MKLSGRGRLCRRDFVRWIGASALALPMLELFEGDAVAQSAQRRSKFLVLLYMPDGVNSRTFWPIGTETDFQLSPILTPLTPYKDKLIILGPERDADNVPIEGTGLTYNSKPPEHRAAITTTATSVWLPLHDQQDTVINKIDGPSIDQVVARQVQADSLFASLPFGLHPIGGDTPSDINFDANGNPLKRLAGADEAWSHVFGGAAGRDPGAVALAESELRKHEAVSDFLHSRFASLRSRLSSYDRRIIDQHLTSLRTYEARKAALLRMSTDDAAMCREPVRRSVPTEAVSMRSGADTEFLAPFFNDLISTSFACNITKVASVAFGYPGGGSLGGLRMPWLDFGDALHGLSHHQNDPIKLEKYAKALTWIASQVADLMAKLAAVKTPRGTLLDETTLYWFSEHGDGNMHTSFALPNLILGGTGGYFKTGRFLTLPRTSPTKVLISLANAMGVDLPSFGSGAMMDTMPLAGLAA